MPAIAHIGTIITVTPWDEIQIVLGPGDGNYELIDDRSPFGMRVDGVYEDENGNYIGVHGPVTFGHQRYLNQIATLFVRGDGSDWCRDNSSTAGFKVGQTRAILNGKFPFYHPHGSDIVGYPYILRFGSINSRVGNETSVNSASIRFQTCVDPSERFDELAFSSRFPLEDCCQNIQSTLDLPEFVIEKDDVSEVAWSVHADVEYFFCRLCDFGGQPDRAHIVPEGCNFRVVINTWRDHPHLTDPEWILDNLVSSFVSHVSKALQTTVIHHQTWFFRA